MNDDALAQKDQADTIDSTDAFRLKGEGTWQPYANTPLHILPHPYQDNTWVTVLAFYFVAARTESAPSSENPNGIPALA